MFVKEFALLPGALRIVDERGGKDDVQRLYRFVETGEEGCARRQDGVHVGKTGLVGEAY